MKFFSSLAILLCFGLQVQPAWSLPNKRSPETFVLTCGPNASEWDRVPLGLYELHDDFENLKILPNYVDLLIKIAPMTFKNFKNELSKFTFTEFNYNFPDYSFYDSILLPPKDCRVDFAILTRDFKQVTINARTSKTLSKETRDYFLFELLIQKYLDPSLGPSDIRRFALYIATGKFNEFTTEQKTIFLKYHGINEFSQTGVSLDLKRDLLFYEDSGALKDGYAYPKATFEGGEINSQKFVSFWENGKVKGVATLTPFTRVIKGQSFSLITPIDQYCNVGNDQRYCPRTTFWKNGNLQESMTLPVTQFLNIVTNIKKPLFSTESIFKMYFYEDSTPLYFSAQPYAGEMVLFNKVYPVGSLSWWANGTPKEVSFTRPFPFILPNEGKTDVRMLLIDNDGKIEGRAL